MREIASLNLDLVRGYLAEDPEAQALVAVVAINADLGSDGTSTDTATAASHINPLHDLDVEDARTLLFEIETIDPFTGERHSFSSSDEDLWRSAIVGLIHEEWIYTPGISVVIEETGGPRSYGSHSPHIRAA